LFVGKAIRFPRLPRSRRRGPSARHVVYLGTHPVVMMMSLAVYGLMISFYISVVMIVLTVYLAYDLALIRGWLWQLGTWQLQARRLGSTR
jgi:uncharacterized membrane protein YdbT with pleckstrin-like domain